ncbi:hypothetical protein B0J12DRAFT_414919 [Macrophomina phaseolina]|uniref:Uncharacterized protein n=1 Tax=Macrophomina phaseolina TaxID=35725 RepID=A0ABQ8FRT0_9PEZI|nr:hypothetical protein B0J12DRAFT_414919 [Macrophomina phaseolina]
MLCAMRSPPSRLPLPPPSTLPQRGVCTPFRRGGGIIMCIDRRWADGGVTASPSCGSLTRQIRHDAMAPKDRATGNRGKREGVKLLGEGRPTVREDAAVVTPSDWQRSESANWLEKKKKKKRRRRRRRRGSGWPVGDDCDGNETRRSVGWSGLALVQPVTEGMRPVDAVTVRCCRSSLLYSLRQDFGFFLFFFSSLPWLDEPYVHALNHAI